jgi:hypothetical protein
MPTVMKITGRTSSITNAFVSSIIPSVQPSAEEVVEALAILGMSVETIACAYCGDRCTEWDHLRPLVERMRPTGYVSEICNLVPACGKCNQSKGNRPWRSWIRSPASLSPATRGIPDLEERIQRLDTYEAWRDPVRLDLELVAGADLWQRHWRNCDEIHRLMVESDKTALTIRERVLAEAKRSVGSDRDSAAPRSA